MGSFHSAYVFCSLIILPTICVIYEYKRSNSNKLSYYICKWFVFWCIGFRCTTAALMQILNPSYTAALLQVESGANFIIQELGCAQLGIGVLGILSLIKEEFRKSTCLSCSVFMILVSILHIVRLSSMNLGECISLIGDTIILIVSVWGFFYSNVVSKKLLKS